MKRNILILFFMVLSNGIIAQSGLPDIIPPSGPVSSPVLERYDQKYKYDTSGFTKSKPSYLEQANRDFDQFLKSGPSNDVKYRSKSVGNQVAAVDNFAVVDSFAKVDSVFPNSSITSNSSSNTSTLVSSSNDTKLDTKSFNWEQSNASRYVNSPCYKILGFKPDGGVEQEKRYKECEEEYNTKPDYIAIASGVFIVTLILVFLIYFIFSKDKQPVRGLDNQVAKSKANPINQVDGVIPVNFKKLLPLLHQARINNQVLTISNLGPYTFKQFENEKIGIDPQTVIIDYRKKLVTFSVSIANVAACDTTVLINSEEAESVPEVINLSPIKYDFAICASVMISNEKVVVLDNEFGNYIRFENPKSWVLKIS